MSSTTQTGLPRDTFAKFSPHPYLLASLDPRNKETRPARSNGRPPHLARDIRVNLSSLTHAHGSALVKAGGTTAICGVRAESLVTADIPNFRASNRETELTDYDLLVPNIELATGCAPQFLPGVPPTNLAQTLSTRVYSLLHCSKLVKPDDLRIWSTSFSDRDEDKMAEDDQEGDEIEGESVVMAYWVLYIDIFFISFDGNPFDVAWAAVVAALRDTQLPLGQWDPDREMVLCSNNDWTPLNLTGLPVACTAVVFTEKDIERPSEGKYWLLLDPDSQEEELCDEVVTMVVDRSGGETQILSISKHGGTVASPELLRGYVKVAEKRWDEFETALKTSE